MRLCKKGYNHLSQLASTLLILWLSFSAKSIEDIVMVYRITNPVPYVPPSTPQRPSQLRPPFMPRLSATLHWHVSP
ncbi:hypothetical protein BGW80DRAFT_1322980 [Lactifluus volemus]|nr:hypothetical protein BGW80DRAFT_1322980 [Lactifluus volemus]